MEGREVRGRGKGISRAEGQGLGKHECRWGRLHPKEMEEVQGAIERGIGRSLTASEMIPVLAVLNDWAKYRYETARKSEFSLKRGRVRREQRVELLPAPDWGKRKQVVASEPAKLGETANAGEEKLPWE